uniref:Mitochondrial import receptor subunit TOM6 homolog n=1 Tax=Moschus moschiferus TaxID=68415 RepID=A0A8C6DZJ0_MOSMO
MASSGAGVTAAGSANEAPEMPDNVGDWLRGVYRFATHRNDFRRNLILNLGLFPPICDHHKTCPDGG